MPPHKLDESYAHIVQAGARNVCRLIGAGDLRQAQVEAEHLQFVADLLDGYLLHGRWGDARYDEAAHAVYWHRVRPAYIAQADSASLKELESAWDCLLWCIDRDEWERRYLERLVRRSN